MSFATNRTFDVAAAAKIVRDAGGRVVGRTRLQKIAYVLELAGLGEGFKFEYRHYGPYSEDLSTAVQSARLFDFLQEVVHPTQWGGHYSVYTSNLSDDFSTPNLRRELAERMANADSIELELAATAAFLAYQGVNDPWQETYRRKPEKADNARLCRAKSLYRDLRTFRTPQPLPDI